MAKLVPVQLYCISVIGGIYSNGDKFIIMSLNENQNANSGAIKIISDNTDLYYDIIAAVKEQGINIAFARKKKDFKRIFLNSAISVGEGIIFKDTNVPIVLKVIKNDNGTEKRIPLVEVSGVALLELGESVQSLVEIEMIRRCNNHQAFLPVKGQDYSRFLYTDTPWKVIFKTFFHYYDDMVVDIENGNTVMKYPLISEYVKSIKYPEENFNKLSNLRPVIDTDGNPIMSSGNFAVVFKMEDRQSRKLYAVKCFLREQEGRNENYRLIASELEYLSSTYLTPIQYLEKELFVDTTQGNDTEFPVLLMDWVEGPTLDKYIRKNIHDPYKLALITYQFCRMGSWLLSQEFAHGDLKPDNIIVREDGQLVLVDYDGMFVPAMRGQKSRELGSVDYRHPLRTEDLFDGSIDDFSIASIALSLKAISLNPELLNVFGVEDRLLFCAKDYQNISDSECLKAIQLLANDTELSQLLGLFYIAYGKNELNNISYKLFNISKPNFFMTPILESEIRLSTKVTKEDLANAVEDEFGVLYSKDGKRLLKCKDGLKTYSIKNNTNVICDRAFSFCKSLQQIEIPDSLKYIGDFAFLCCSNLQKIIIPRSVEIIGRSAFENCFSLTICSYNDRFIIYDNIFLIDKREEKLIACLTDLEQITIPGGVTSIGASAFSGCHSLQQITIPDSVTTIGDCAFNCCSSLKQIIIPDSVTTIGRAAFCNCTSLQEIEIPNSVRTIGYVAFRFCHSLQQVTIPNSVTTIENGAFSSCKTLKQIVLPDSLITIGKGMLVGCKSLQSIIVPKYKTDRYKNLLKYSNCDLSIIKEKDD